ncbi:MAG: endonuclease/exonuclease/phosphatase family protein [Bacteriovoracaceae bacterium]|nr:endonuclease/exonuclease/phosphatase family protein [Bacteriovoracaceae bacterium]
MARIVLFSLLLITSTFVFSKNSQAKSIKALSYNIWGLPYPIAKRVGRFKLIQKRLPKLEADIIALQEAFTKKAKTSSKSNRYPYKAFGPSSSFLKLSSGLIIMSKYPIMMTKTIKFNECQGWDCFANKGVVLARVLIENQELDVYATHLNAEGEDEGPRYHQLRDFIDFVKENSTGRKAIFLGDFNFPDSSFLHEMFTNELSLNDSHQEYVLDNPNLPDDELRGSTSSSGKRIDYVFVTPDLKVEKSMVVFKDKLYKGKQLSDHRAVISTFEL